MCAQGQTDIFHVKGGHRWRIGDDGAKVCHLNCILKTIIGFQSFQSHSISKVYIKASKYEFHDKNHSLLNLCFGSKFIYKMSPGFELLIEFT